MLYIIVTTDLGDEVWPINTEAEHDDAVSAMIEAGMTEAAVWSGDPEDGDSVKTRLKVILADPNSDEEE